MILPVRILDGYYETVEDGYQQSTPVLHIFGRDPKGRRRHITVDDYRPYFCVTYSEWTEVGESIAEDGRILRVETEDRQGRDETSIYGEPLVRIVCREPEDVSDLRELFEDPYEADVLFPVRALVDLQVTQWLLVENVSQSDYEACVGTDDPLAVSIEDIQIAPDSDDVPAVAPPPRLCTYDIEVRQHGSGPSVVTEDGCERTPNPITAIAAHDSYVDAYRLWVLAPTEWDTDDAESIRSFVGDLQSHGDTLGGLPIGTAGISIYQNPEDVVGQFLKWVQERDFSALCGWNASGFDHPYLINYALNNGLWSVKELSPTRDVYELSGDGSFINSSLKGRLLLDLMTLYEKVNIHELDSKRLADVAEAEDVAVGKLSIEDVVPDDTDLPSIDWAWKYDPETFVEYALRDVAACVAINRSSVDTQII